MKKESELYRAIVSLLTDYAIEDVGYDDETHKKSMFSFLERNYDTDLEGKQIGALLDEMQLALANFCDGWDAATRTKREMPKEERR